LNETNSNGDWTAQGRTSPTSTNVGCRSCPKRTGATALDGRQSLNRNRRRRDTFGYRHLRLVHVRDRAGGMPAAGERLPVPRVRAVKSTRRSNTTCSWSHARSCTLCHSVVPVDLRIGGPSRRLSRCASRHPDRHDSRALAAPLMTRQHAPYGGDPTCGHCRRRQTVSTDSARPRLDQAEGGVERDDKRQREVGAAEDAAELLLGAFAAALRDEEHLQVTVSFDSASRARFEVLG
jgi:hypothetical protein